MINNDTNKMAQQPEDKKRRLDSSSSSSSKENPILFLNVGGAKRNVRRSVWMQLRDASCGLIDADISGNERFGNPLCNLVLMGAAHWSDVPTTSDEDGTIRIYLDRNPQAFDDLLQYIEYGKIFLKSLINKDDCGARLERLKIECDYFTVDAILKDLDEVMYGEAVSLRSDGCFKLAGKCFIKEGEVRGWNWRVVSENESIAGVSSKGLALCSVNETGTYLMFYSLHSVAVTAPGPGQFYPQESSDECAQVSVFHSEMTGNEDGNWTYPLVRVGAFDYRDTEAREEEPLLFTAAFAEPVSLKKGNELYCSHGKGAITPRALRQAGRYEISAAVNEHSPFSEEEPNCLNFMTLVRVFGDSIAKWNAKSGEDPKSEHSVIKWIPAQDDLPKTSQGAYLDETDETKIRFRKAGYYLLLGRVASKLKKNLTDDLSSSWGAVRVEHRTNGGLPLQIDPEIISYPSNYSDPPSYNKKRAEYGPINDIIYAEKDSYVSVRATKGACFAWHGTVPSPSVDKIPTQSLSTIRLDHDMRVDRYHVSIQDGNITYKRALGGEESVPNQAPLFDVVDIAGSRYTRSMSQLKALEDCCCIVIGCLSCRVGNTVSLYKNDDAIIHSQLCKGTGHGYGSHTLNTVVEIKANDTVYINYGDESGGHLAFLRLQ
jgi:hypothetical protein